MDEKKINKKYKEYMKKQSKLWDFGNEILYSMCRENPYHEDEGVIIGKIWLIGRSYAAAIERRKTKDKHDGDSFYCDVVAPKMKAIGKELDERIETLRGSENTIYDDLDLILDTHEFLAKAFFDITKSKKRSLASKYLHFHCPSKFFIFDSRAQSAIGKFRITPDKSIVAKTAKKDSEYADFVCRALILQDYLREKYDFGETPRDIDNFLLSVAKKK